MGGLPTAGSKPGGYVPPSLKNRGAGETVDSRKREENSLRVTNLSEDTREEDLRVGHLFLGSISIIVLLLVFWAEIACFASVLSEPLTLCNLQISDDSADYHYHHCHYHVR